VYRPVVVSCHTCKLHYSESCLMTCSESGIAQKKKKLHEGY
jgi:hypothetical protein